MKKAAFGGRDIVAEDNKKEDPNKGVQPIKQTGGTGPRVDNGSFDRKGDWGIANNSYEVPITRPNIGPKKKR